MDLYPIQRALLSVSDTNHLVELATILQQHSIDILATTSTAAFLRKHNITVTDVADYTGFPEILGGRVKTLHPKIHGGILARRHQDEDTLKEHAILAIDLVVVNLYPFEKTISTPDCALTKAIENIDIGGPSMLRAAAKNYSAVTVVVDPEDYKLIGDAITQQKGTTLNTRLYLAQKVFAHTAFYDALIANYLLPHTNPVNTYPELFVAGFRKRQDLRYGENPQQSAAFYREPLADIATIGAAHQLLGKELSFNNIVDSDAAYSCVKAIPQPSCVIVKHANPCGVAIGNTCLEAYQRAYSSDPTSAFGGIIAINDVLDEALAKLILEQQFVEVILAPEITQTALALLQQKPAVRVLQTSKQSSVNALDLKRISGGLLLQQSDSTALSDKDIKVVTHCQPTADEMRQLKFAWHVVRFVKSNAIVTVKNYQTIGIGAGQTSRVLSVSIALQQAITMGFDNHGAVLASDAFFPFPDSIALAAEAGITAIIQPGGSRRDEEVIAAANEANIAMVFTGVRHFRH